MATHLRNNVNIAQHRALKLMDDKFAGATQKVAKPRGVVTAKQAADAAYAAEQKRKDASKLAAMKYDAEEKQRKMASRILVVPKKREKMAESTRRNMQTVTPDDVRDPESIAGMKCQLDVDRQKAAEVKALKMMTIDSEILV